MGNHLCKEVDANALDEKRAVWKEIDAVLPTMRAHEDATSAYNDAKSTFVYKVRGGKKVTITRFTADRHVVLEPTELSFDKHTLTWVVDRAVLGIPDGVHAIVKSATLEVPNGTRIEWIDATDADGWFIHRSDAKLHAATSLGKLACNVDAHKLVPVPLTEPVEEERSLDFWWDKDNNRRTNRARIRVGISATPQDTASTHVRLIARVKHTLADQKTPPTIRERRGAPLHFFHADSVRPSELEAIAEFPPIPLPKGTLALCAIAVHVPSHEGRIEDVALLRKVDGTVLFSAPGSIAQADFATLFGSDTALGGRTLLLDICPTTTQQCVEYLQGTKNIEGFTPSAAIDMACIGRCYVRIRFRAKEPCPSGVRIRAKAIVLGGATAKKHLMDVSREVGEARITSGGVVASCDNDDFF